MSSPLIAEAPILFSFSGQVYAKSVMDGAVGNTPVTSVLTYPTADYAGDRVKPDGGDWKAYNKAVPVSGGYDPDYVNWSHRIPIGRGTVKHRLLKFDGQTSPVAVGDTTFLYVKADVEGLDLRRRDPRTHRSWDKEKPYTIDEVLEASAQSERLVRDDIATGVSIEFDVDQRRKGQDWWDLSEKSLLENRPARHFEVWRGLGYAHARQPVNPGCHTVAGQKRFIPTSAAVEKAITIAQTGKLPGGEKLCPIILKSFEELTHYRSPNVSVLIEGTPPTETPVTVKGDVTETSTTINPEGDVAKPNGGHQTALNIIQGLMDLCKQAENNGSDDLSFRRYFKRLCGKMKDLAGDIKARAEKHKGKLDAHDKGAAADDDTDPMDEDDYKPSMEEKAIEVDADGAIIVKSFPDWKPRRMTFANIVDASTAPAPVPAVTVKSKPSKEEKLLNQRLTEALNALTPLLEAGAANGVL